MFWPNMNAASAAAQTGELVLPFKTLSKSYKHQQLATEHQILEKMSRNSILLVFTANMGKLVKVNLTKQHVLS